MMYKILCGGQINFRFEEVKNQTLFLIFLKPLVSIFLLKHISMILFSHTETIFDSSYILVHNKMQFSDDIMKFLNNFRKFRQVLSIFPSKWITQIINLWGPIVPFHIL